MRWPLVVQLQSGLECNAHIEILVGKMNKDGLFVLSPPDADRDFNGIFAGNLLTSGDLSPASGQLSGSKLFMSLVKFHFRFLSPNGQLSATESLVSLRGTKSQVKNLNGQAEVEEIA